jgi:hypothetical protein
MSVSNLLLSPATDPDIIGYNLFNRVILESGGILALKIMNIFSTINNLSQIELSNKFMKNVLKHEISSPVDNLNELKQKTVEEIFLNSSNSFDINFNNINALFPQPDG